MTIDRRKYDAAVTALYWTIVRMPEGPTKDALAKAHLGITEAVNAALSRD